MNAVALHANLVSMSAEAAGTRWAALRAKAEALRGPSEHKAGGCTAKELAAFSEVKSVVPLRFVAPRPRWSLSRILSWQEREEEAPPATTMDCASTTYMVSSASCVPPQSRGAHDIFQSPGQGGILGKLLLAAGRRGWEREGSDEAPAWPPAPELVANPPNWGKVQTANTMATPAVILHPSPQSDDGEYAPPPGLPSSALGLNLPPIAPRGTVSPGYFIGSDGTEWPIPPPECMPSPWSSPSPRGISGSSSHPSDTSEDGNEVPFTTEGDEVHTSSCSPACSSALSSLPRTPEDRLLAQSTKGDCGSRWGVIGDGRPGFVCPPAPFLRSRELVLTSPLSSWASDVEPKSEYSSGSEYSSESEYSSDEDV